MYTDLYIDKNNITKPFSQFFVVQSELRELHEHRRECVLVEEDVGGKSGYSTTYGINKRSILMDLPYFDVTKCLPFDIMHTIYEGIITILV